MEEKESIISVRHKWTNLSLGSPFGITRQSLVMPNSDPWDRFVHPYLTLMSDSYTLTYSAIKLWNELTKTIKNIDKEHKFIAAVKSFFI